MRQHEDVFGGEYIHIIVPIIYTGDVDIEIKPILGTIGMKNISFSGVLNVLLGPLISTSPVVSSFQAFFYEQPVIDVDFTGLGNVADLPIIEKLVRSSIQSRIAQRFVFPNKLVVPFSMDAHLHATSSRIQSLPKASLAFPPPGAVLRLVLDSVDGLQYPSADVLNMDPGFESNSELSSDMICDIRDAVLHAAWFLEFSVGSASIRTRPFTSQLPEELLADMMIFDVKQQNLNVVLATTASEKSDNSGGVLGFFKSSWSSKFSKSDWILGANISLVHLMQRRSGVLSSDIDVPVGGKDINTTLEADFDSNNIINLKLFSATDNILDEAGNKLIRANVRINEDEIFSDKHLKIASNFSGVVLQIAAISTSSGSIVEQQVLHLATPSKPGFLYRFLSQQQVDSPPSSTGLQENEKQKTSLKKICDFINSTSKEGILITIVGMTISNGRHSSKAEFWNAIDEETRHTLASLGVSTHFIPLEGSLETCPGSFAALGWAGSGARPDWLQQVTSPSANCSLHIRLKLSPSSLPSLMPLTDPRGEPLLRLPLMLRKRDGTSVRTPLSVILSVQLLPLKQHLDARPIAPTRLVSFDAPPAVKELFNSRGEAYEHQNVASHIDNTTAQQVPAAQKISHVSTAATVEEKTPEQLEGFLLDSPPPAMLSNAVSSAKMVSYGSPVSHRPPHLPSVSATWQHAPESRVASPLRPTSPPHGPSLGRSPLLRVLTVLPHLPEDRFSLDAHFLDDNSMAALLREQPSRLASSRPCSISSGLGYTQIRTYPGMAVCEPLSQLPSPSSLAAWVGVDCSHAFPPDCMRDIITKQLSLRVVIRHLRLPTPHAKAANSRYPPASISHSPTLPEDGAILGIAVSQEWRAPAKAIGIIQATHGECAENTWETGSPEVDDLIAKLRLLRARGLTDREIENVLDKKVTTEEVSCWLDGSHPELTAIITPSWGVGVTFFVNDPLREVIMVELVRGDVISTANPRVAMETATAGLIGEHSPDAPSIASSSASQRGAANQWEMSGSYGMSVLSLAGRCGVPADVSSIPLSKIGPNGEVLRASGSLQVSLQGLQFYKQPLFPPLHRGDSIEFNRQRSIESNKNKEPANQQNKKKKRTADGRKITRCCTTTFSDAAAEASRLEPSK